MLATEVMNILKDSSLNGYGFDFEYYIYNVPKTENNNNSIVILVTEVSNKPIKYGSNLYLDKQSISQVQIFYPVYFDEDCEKLENDILTKLESCGWNCITGRTDSDPDTDRIFTTLHFQKLRERGL